MHKIELVTLHGDLELEAKNISAAVSRVQAARGRVRQDRSDIMLWYSLAYLIHNLYNGLEAYFLRIARAFENGLPPADWHKVLVERMSVAVEGFRPALLGAIDRTPFQELRAFRHLVRHLYDREIDPRRVEALDEHLDHAIERFPILHAQFLAAIDHMAALADS